MADLLEKVKGYGIIGNILCWLQAFLVGRSQRVVVNGSVSSWKPVTSDIEGFARKVM